ncbi:MAG: hypothetical protein AAGC57_05990 [Pseudomonadota bacterium]
MRNNSTCELDPSWWNREKPKALKKSAGGFEKALAGYVKIQPSLRNGVDTNVKKSVDAVLGAIAGSAKDVISEAKALQKTCSDKAEKKDLSNTIDVMGKPLQKALDAVRSEVEDLVSASDDEEEEAGAFGGPSAHGDYIRKLAPKLKKRTYNFALGLKSNDPSEMRFLFHLKKGGRSLGAQLKSKAGSKKFTFGTAGTQAPIGPDGEDESKARTLLLTLEGRKIPGLAKRVKVMLKSMKVASFSKVKIVVDGLVEESGEEDDDTLDTLDLSAIPDEAMEESSGGGTAPDPEGKGPVWDRVVELQRQALKAIVIPESVPLMAAHRLKAAHALIATKIDKATTTEDLKKTSADIETLKETIQQAIKRTVKSEANFEGLKKQIAKMIAELPRDLPPLKRVPTEIAAANDKQKAGQEDAGRTQLLGIISTVQKAGDEFQTQVTKRLTMLVELSDPDGSTDDEKAKLKTARDKITELLTGKDPSWAKLVEASKAIKKLQTLHAKIHRSAAERAAMAHFNAALGGDVGVDNASMATQEGTVTTKQQAFDTARQALETAQALPESTPQEQAARATAIATAAAQLQLAQAERDQALERLEVMRDKRALTDALQAGPLGSDAPKGFSDAATAQLIEAFTKDRKLAEAAMASALMAKDPDAVAANVGALIDQMNGGFAAADGRKLPGGAAAARSYAEDLLRMGGQMGGDYFEDAQAYIAAGHHLTADPVGDGAITDTKERDRKRSAFMADALMAADGTIDPNSAAAQAAFGHLRFSPGTIEHQTPVLNEHIAKRLAMLNDGANRERAQELLNDTSAPTNPVALSLLRKALGKGDADPITDEEAKQVLLGSLLTPVGQNEVGSCFATAGVRRQSETDPLAMMEKLKEIATTGFYTPANGDDALPAITSIRDGDDQLIRALEYSVATAGARQANSIMRRNLAVTFDDGVEQYKEALGHEGTWDAFLEMIGKSSWPRERANIVAAIGAGFTFTYDSGSDSGAAADGSSHSGRFVLVRVTSGAEIRTRAAYVAAITDISQTALGLDPASEKGQAIANLCASDAFINAVAQRNPAGELTYKPWELPGGGFTTTADNALLGGNPSGHQMMAKDTTSQSEGARSRALLEGMLGMFDGRDDSMVSFDTQGIHTFNGLPNHPSLDVLKGDTPAERQANIQTHLIDAGTALRDTALSVPRTQSAYDAFFEAFAEKIKGKGWAARARTKLGTDVPANRPTTGMKPKDVLDHAMATADDALDLIEADLGNADWNKAKLVGWLRGVFKGKLAEDLTHPQFVIADTNWGTGENHTYFVIAPDPVTGEAKMWKRTDPPGRLSEMDEKWLDTQWRAVE